ncbi:trifunctional hydroxymethylpyrimidine kinase/phosphomethylpyrimidine kinase/thiaminase [Coniosporium apollinis]|uniref:Trifunctional hydroxymethylpyrimidine kinase/phosphomethylpyrimidine kinase/thiaminase n=2 Tax=Coniosporium TaxID=2810619 RepID=A0ABQ9NPH2_9PEZI|nr:trifunctional hydroxymethylpyrimidine kinase/phosphomethylpyrimidine kinase/thiaminase [Cladosporium sp. JES 115]KAJ9663585.1 trifunctional hydroxymethylpyrimidine kinase/phosphomethylpyrimidine kinase/thiaminase [Coniosporium apollinis]
MTATTALTAQNTQGVYGIHETPSDFVKKQIDACIDDIGVDVVKTDQVMVATSGAQLLREEAVETLCKQLLPVVTILTPNMPEALLLLKTSGQAAEEPKALDDIINIAKAVQQLGPKYVLLKGGHLPLTKDRVVSTKEADHHSVINILCGEDQTIVLETGHLRSKNTHGTGCSLASAIASNLACGMKMAQAVKAANLYVEAGIRTSKDLGKGSGPINHFHSVYHLPFSPGHFVDYVLDREDVKKAWLAYSEHDFVKQLAKGALPLEKFKNYLIQDFLFLIHFSRANALAAYKAKSLEDIKRSAENVTHIQEEVKLHIEYCKEFGLSQDEIENEEESEACTAYTRYVLDVGQSEDWLALQIALAPCLLGYGSIARRLHDDPETMREGNKYWKWIESYVSNDYTEAVRNGRDLIEKHAVKQSASRIEELVRIFIHATRMETGFWNMGSREVPGR